MASKDDNPVSSPWPQERQQQHQQPETLLYFAFGSNLSSTQMRARCPGAKAVGLAYLPGYEFIINERGFANVVPANNNNNHNNNNATATTAGGGGGGGGVYGVLYRLASAGEKARLDGYEGVPSAYEDLVLDVEQLFSSSSSGGGGVPTLPSGGDGSSSSSNNNTNSSSVVRALVYVDRRRVSPAPPRAEYVVRMNTGIREAVAEWGLPRDYVRDVMRRYIPIDHDDES